MKKKRVKGEETSKETDCLLSENKVEMKSHSSNTETQTMLLSTIIIIIIITLIIIDEISYFLL